MNIKHHFISFLRIGGIQSFLPTLLALLSLPQAARAIDTVYINSQADWTSFCSKYNDTEVNVLLNTDVTINTQGYQMKKFKGTLDGQGHAFVITYKDDKSNSENKAYYDKNWTKDSAPFYQAQGTIKNLHLTGTVAIRYGYLAFRWNNPLAQVVCDTLSIENCHSDIAFVNTETWGKFNATNNAPTGGFVGKVAVSSKSVTPLLTFNNCSFTGSFIYTYHSPIEFRHTGGFVGHLVDGNIVINNCLSYVAFDDRATLLSFDHFVGYKSKGEFTLNDSYAYSVNMKGEPKALYKDTEDYPYDLNGSGRSKCITSGELAMTLNTKGKAAANKWVQTLGTDSLPRLRTFFPSSLEVSHKDETTHKTRAYGWSTFFSPFDVLMPLEVTPYVVTGLNEAGKRVLVSTYSGSVKNVPLLLYTDGKAQTITVPAGYYNKVEQNNTLRGAYETTAAVGGDYALNATDREFVPATESHAPWQCYIVGGTADSYALKTDAASNVCRISSKSDWAALRNSYSYYEGIATDIYLDTDLTLTDSDAITQTFSGNLYGQGHTITLPASTDDSIKAAFTDFNGSVSLLNVDCPDGDGVFISGLTQSVTFTDCRFTDVLSAHGSSGSTTKFCNTLFRYSGADVGFYYDAKGKQVSATSAEIASGMVAYRLNDGRTGDAAVWKQTVGEDDTPQLLSTTSKEVFHAEATTRESTSDKWATLFYPADIDLSSNADLRIYDNFGLAGDTLYCYENLSGQLYAGTPALLYSPSGLPAIKLPELYYNKVEQATEFIGVYADTDASALNTLTIQNDSAYFKTNAETLPAWQCYTTSLATVVDDGTVITSKADWNKFKTRYSGRTTNARLVCDLELTAEDEPMKNFAGTFNGTMATITLNDAPAPFQQAKGLIKQLTVKGTPASGSAAIVGVASGNLTLQDCHSSAGALLGYTASDAKAHKVAQTSAIAFNSCLTIDGTDTLAYVGNNATAEKVTAEQLKSGELTYKLNNGRTAEDAVWLQTIGTDPEPSLTSFTAEEVFEAKDTILIPTTGWATHYYPVAIAKPEGVKVFTVTGVTVSEKPESTEPSGNSEAATYVVELTEIEDSIPAYTPVLLSTLSEGETVASEPMTIAMPTLYYNELDTMRTDPTTTAKYILLGSEEDTESFDNCYLLQNDTLADGTVSPIFRLAEADSEGLWPTIAQWSSVLFYLGSEESADPETSTIYLTKDDDITGINPARMLNALISTGNIYDLGGRQITGGQLQKGQVYIKNGQKFIVR